MASAILKQNGEEEEEEEKWRQKVATDKCWESWERQKGYTLANYWQPEMPSTHVLVTDIYLGHVMDDNRMAPLATHFC